MSTQIYILKVEDVTGKNWRINLDHIGLVEFPTTDPATQLNLNVEVWHIVGLGNTLRMPVGALDAAIDELITEHDSGAQEFRPGNYIKRQTAFA